MRSSTRLLTLPYILIAAAFIFAAGQDAYWMVVFRIVGHAEAAGHQVAGALLINLYLASFLHRWGWLIAVGLVVCSGIAYFLFAISAHRKNSKPGGAT